MLPFIPASSLPDLDLLPKRSIRAQWVSAAGHKWEKKNGKFSHELMQTNVHVRFE